ncbi:MAG: nitronate monooxygenase [Alphaproteobacteria bacterium]|nr:MAG: nitronate monooxygenase [Alphaproteobacteria bacterium]
MAWPNRRFLDLVGTEVPIVQAPMAGAGGVDLCVGAIEGGALGSLPCGLLTPDEVRAQVSAVRERVRGPINLNFFCHTMPEGGDEAPWKALLRPYYDEFGVAPGPPGPLRMPFDPAMCGIVEEVRPEVVSFHFGLPSEELLRRVKASGAVVIGNATTPEEARWLEARGVDAVIAQGFEAGGHSGRFLGSDPAAALGLIALLPQVVDSVSVPVIAAGGIGDGRGIAAAFALGASAVQLGTAYLHCPESLIRPEHRAVLAEGGTLFTNLFSGGLARGAPTRLVRDLGPVRAEVPPYPLAAAALAPLKNVSGFTPMWAGQSAPLGRALPAAELTRSLAADALAVLGRLS